MSAETAESRRQAVIYGLVAMVSFPMGIFLFLLFGNELRRQEAAPGWPTARGTVTSAEVRKLKGGSYGKDVVVVRYEYSVENRTYRGGVFHLGSAHSAPLEGSSRSIDYGSVPDPAAWTAAHPKGSAIDVRYDPKNPGDAVLDVTPTIGPSSLLFGGSFIAAGVLFVAFSVRGFRKPRPAPTP